MIWDTSRMYGILVLCMRSRPCRGSMARKQRPGSRIVAGHSSAHGRAYMEAMEKDTSLMYGILVLCLGY